MYDQIGAIRKHFVAVLAAIASHFSLASRRRLGELIVVDDYLAIIIVVEAVAGDAGERVNGGRRENAVVRGVERRERISARRCEEARLLVGRWAAAAAAR